MKTSFRQNGMEGSCPVVVRHVDEPEATGPIREYVKAFFRGSRWTFMTEEDRLFDFMKGLQPTPKCPRLRGGIGS